MKLPRLREWRELRGKTQTELAAKSGRSARSIASYEAGGDARPNTARLLAEALDVSIPDLVGSESPKGQAPLPESSEERREELRMIRELLTDAHGLLEEMADEYKATGATDKLTTLVNVAMFSAIGAEQFVKEEVGPAQDRASTRVYAAGSRLEEFIEDLLETIQSTTTVPVGGEVAYLDAHRRRRAS